MKFSKFSADTVCELLSYLADNDEFASLKNLKEFKKKEVSEILKEIAAHLKQSTISENNYQKADLNGFELSSTALSLISCLSPREETILFKSFNLL